MSRFHRDTFHPVRPDRSPVPTGSRRSMHGRRIGSAQPPEIARPGSAAPAAPLDLRREPPASRGAASTVRARKTRRKRA